MTSLEGRKWKDSVLERKDPRGVRRPRRSAPRAARCHFLAAPLRAVGVADGHFAFGRWRSPRSRVVALHSVPFDASPADIDLYALDDPTTIAKCICDLLEERPSKISAMRSN